MRRPNIYKIVALATVFVLTSSSRQSLTAQDAIPSANSLSLKLTGPSLVRAGDWPHFRAFLVNNSKKDVEVPLSSSLDAVMYLDWKIVDVSRHQTSTHPVGHTLCNFGKKFTQEDFVVLSPGQRLELIGIRIPEDLLRPDEKGLYRISLHYSFPHTGTFIMPDDILQEKPHYNLASNEMTIVFTER
jgi:hypothetical protein